VAGRERDGSRPPKKGAAGRRVLAYAVHALTASGAVIGLLALDSTARHAWKDALLWMALGTLVDAVDGALARAADVKRWAPRIDGALLDNVVDYLGFVVVPAFFLAETGLLAGGWLGPAAICLASAYQFAQTDAKTPDHYFKGFPSYWNLLALYLHVFGTPPEVNLALVLALAVLVFVPIRYIYPSRTVPLRRTTLTLGILWAASVAATLLLLPDPPAWLPLASLAYVAYYVGASLYLHLRHVRARRA
jgi:phosphatidylcholine synthase